MMGLQLPPHTNAVVFAQVTRTHMPLLPGWRLLLVDVVRRVPLVINDRALYALYPLRVEDGDLMLVSTIREPVQTIIRYDMLNGTLSEHPANFTPDRADDNMRESPSGAQAVVWDAEGLTLLAADRDTLIDHFTLPEPIFRVTWSPDARWLAVHASDGTVARLYTIDLQTGTVYPLNTAIAGGRDIEFAMWSPDSRYLLSGSSNFTGGFGVVSDPTGAYARRLTDEPVGYRGWSASGRYLFYGVRGNNGVRLDIRDADADFSFVERINNVATPSWLADHDTLYFIADARASTSPRRLIRFDLTSGVLTAISPDDLTPGAWYAVDEAAQ